MEIDATEALRLAAALFLPWMAGSLWLFRWNPAPSGRLALSLGYGYFLGTVACTSLIRLAYSLDLPPWPFTLAGLSLFLLATPLLPHRSTSQDATPPDPPKKGNPLVLALLLLVLAGHLLPTLLEALVRPLYPWDAWTTWVYRAKIWFLNGELTGFLPPGAASDTPHYELKAWNYPLMVSLAHLWPALALERWSETLVNLPTWLAGLATGLGLYGAARAWQFSSNASLLLSTLFLSVPLVNTHMLLPGYADLWMSGFVGLGLAALLVGNNRGMLILGLLLVAGSLLAKKEGAAWLLLALSFLALASRPRTTLAIIGLIVAAAGWSWHSGQPLPLVGTIQYDGNQLVLGTLGAWPLQFHDVLPAFLHAFLFQGSWNLTWILLAITLLAALLRLGDQGARRALLLLLLSTLLLFAIFFLSPESRWASDLTAINRLPLQILPALLLASLAAWRSWTPKQAPGP